MLINDFFQALLAALAKLKAETTGLLELLCRYPPAFADTWPHTTPLSSQFFAGCHDPSQQLGLLLQQWIFLDNQLPRETLLLPGLFAVDSTIIHQIESLNFAKDQVKTAMIMIKQQGNSWLHEPSWLTALVELLPTPCRPAPVTAALTNLGWARLHLKQLYRHCHIVHPAPQRLAWTWACHTRSIVRITVAQAAERLARLGDGIGIQLQQRQLAELSPSEPLAVVQELAPHLRVNLTFAQGRRRMLKGALPFFYDAQQALKNPLLIPPPERGKRLLDRPIRDDVLLDTSPFLPAIRAYRYRQPPPMN